MYREHGAEHQENGGGIEDVVAMGPEEVRHGLAHAGRQDLDGPEQCGDLGDSKTAGFDATAVRLGRRSRHRAAGHDVAASRIVPVDESRCSRRSTFVAVR